jgi:hypothetical protein
MFGWEVSTLQSKETGTEMAFSEVEESIHVLHYCASFALRFEAKLVAYSRG